MSITWFNYMTIEPGPDQGWNKAWWLHHRSLARNRDRNKNLIINEWIASNIGWYLRLPVPPFSVMRKTEVNTRYFASLDFQQNVDVVPSDFDPELFCERQPQLASGIVIFDIFIANPDRHNGNLKVDDPANPQRTHVFDHDIALLGEKESFGIRRLEKVDGELGFTKLLGDYQVNYVGSAISTSEFFDYWIERVEAIPTQFIEGVCAEAIEFGASKSTTDACASFLLNRRSQLRQIIKSNKGFFGNISTWSLLFQ